MLSSKSVRLTDADGCVPLVLAGCGTPALRRGQSFDKLCGDLMVRPRILPGDQFTIDNHVGLEIDSPSAYVAAGSFEGVRHVEVHLGVKDVIFDPLFFSR